MSDIRNAKEEFLSETRNFKVIAASVVWLDSDLDNEKFSLKPGYSKENYEEFLKFLDRDYDCGYGGQNLYGVIFCEDGVWMQRGEYDGSEWWNTFKYPKLRDSFAESDVLKYERSKKLREIENFNI